MKQIRTPNYDKKIWTNRTNRTHKTPQKWDVIVNHIMEGYMPSTLKYIERMDVTVSAHFIITRKGEIYRQANLKHGAWHCIKRKPSNKIVASRNAPPNLYTVGIEHEGMHKDTKGKLTAEQYKATLEVHKYIIERYEATFKEPFSIDRDHIIGHYEVDTVNRGKSDPGHEFPWEELLTDLVKWDKERKAPPVVEKPAEVPPVKEDKINGPYVNEKGERLWFRSIAGSHQTRLAAEEEVKRMKELGFKNAWLQATYIKEKK